jgi:adenylate kinase
MTTKQVNFAVFVGPPGSGKGTQAKILAQKNQSVLHVSTGDLFRAEIGSGSPLGEAVKAVIEKGSLVSDPVTNQVFDSQVNRLIKEKKPSLVILDGYPRNRSQSERLESFCAQVPGMGKLVVVEFQISGDEVVKRLGGRRINPRTGKIYHIDHSPPQKTDVCDEDKGPLIQRADDRPEVIRGRVEVYVQERDNILSVLGSWSGAAVLDATLPPEKVEGNLKRILKEKLGFES